jgi:hypothetical protein
MPETQAARAELVERLKLAHAEYRAEVTLGWDRTKLFLGLSPLLTVAIAVTAPAASGLLATRLLFATAALVALAGAAVVHRAHTRYQATRAVVQRIEDELGFADLQTTGGQRAARDLPRLEKFRVVDVVRGVLVVIALLDVALAVIR